MYNSIYIKIDDIIGESKDSKHQGWIDVHSFYWKMEQPTENNVSSTGKLIVQDLQVYSKIDKAMPTLMNLSANGKRLEKVVLSVCKSGNEKQNEYLKFSLKHSIISSIEIIKFTKSNQFLESSAIGSIGVKYCFLPSLIEINYHEQDIQGVPGPQVTFTWDVEQNTN